MKYKDICIECKEYKEIEIKNMCKDCCEKIRSVFTYYIDGEEVDYEEYKRRKSL